MAVSGSEAAVRAPRRRAPVRASGVVTFAMIWLLELGAVMTLSTDLPVGPLVDVLLAFAFHLGAATVLSYGFWGPWRFSIPEQKNWAVLGFVLVLAVPVYGLIGFTMAFGLSRLRRRLDLDAPDVLEEFEKYISYDDAVQAEIAAHARKGTARRLEEAAEVAPLIDILKSGDKELKRGAIFSVGKLDRRTAVRILRESLMDPDREIQFYAAGQLSKLEKDLSDHIIKARRRLQVEPESLEARLDLATHSKEYARSGLLDASVERYFVRQAIESYEAVLAREPSRPDALLELAGLRRQQGETQLAVAAYEKALAASPDLREARIGLAHAYFELRDLPRLSAALDALRADGEVPEELRAVADFWRDDAPPPAIPSPEDPDGEAHAD